MPGMRHVGTLFAAIVIAPLAWILLAFGQERSAGAFADAQSSGAFHGGDFLRPLLFLAAAGISSAFSPGSGSHRWAPC